MKLRQEHTTEVAAAKASISKATAYRSRRIRTCRLKSKRLAAGDLTLSSTSSMLMSFPFLRRRQASVLSPSTKRCCGGTRN